MRRTRRSAWPCTRVVAAGWRVRPEPSGPAGRKLKISCGVWRDPKPSDDDLCARPKFPNRQFGEQSGGYCGPHPGNRREQHRLGRCKGESH